MPITEKQALETIKNKNWRLSHLYKIRTKDRKLITFVPNKPQAHYLKNESIRDVILKARQLGFTTLKLIEYLDDTIFTPNTVTAILAHKKMKVEKIFEIVKLAYENLPPLLKPKVSFDNRNELYFPEINSKIYVASETRSETVFNLHISEFDFMRRPEEILLAALESVPEDGGRISIESTANGIGQLFQIWNDPETEFKKHFYNWTWDDTYRSKTDKTMEELKSRYSVLAKEYALIPDIVKVLKIDKEQLAFYLRKINRHKIKAKQEYPSIDREAFISFGRNVFGESILQKHTELPPIEVKWGNLKIWEQPMKGFKYVMGVDTSEGLGKDNSVIEVFNAHTGFQAAELADNNISAGDLADFARNIGLYYNKAFIVPEINSSGISFVDNIKKVYYNIYQRESFDRRNNRTKSLGWRTTGTSKPLLVNDLVRFADDKDIIINSKEALNEMKTFVRTDEIDKKGYGAEGSAKDDRVIAIGLVVQGIKGTPYMRTPKSLAQKRQELYYCSENKNRQKLYSRKNKLYYSIRTKNGIKKY